MTIALVWMGMFGIPVAPVWLSPLLFIAFGAAWLWLARKRNGQGRNILLFCGVLLLVIGLAGLASVLL